MEKPLVTLCIFAYKAEEFIEETIKGAFSQTYDNLEIIISDDNSPDNTFDVIERVVSDYNGPHKVIINKNEKNLGIVAHITKLIHMASGQYIATNPGDDVSTPNRISDTVNYFQNDEIQMVTFSRTDIDEHSVRVGDNIADNDKLYSLNKEYISTNSFMVGGTGVAFRADIFKTFGDLNDDAQTEDSSIRLRALLLGYIVYSKKVGVLYRIHGNNISIGDNQFRLKTDLIAKQYTDDIYKAFNNGVIDGRLKSVLVDKVLYYSIIRKLSEKLAKSNSFVSSFIYKIRKINCHVLYKCKISIELWK